MQCLGHVTCRPVHELSVDDPTYCLPILAIRSLAIVEQQQALPAGYRCSIIRGDAFHFGAMSGFFIARVAQDHAVVIEGMQVAFLSRVSGHRRGLHGFHVAGGPFRSQARSG